jgi:hypothetical protein
MNFIFFLDIIGIFLYIRVLYLEISFFSKFQNFFFVMDETIKNSLTHFLNFYKKIVKIRRYVKINYFSYNLLKIRQYIIFKHK